MSQTIGESHKAVRQIVAIAALLIVLLVIGAAGLLAFAANALNELKGREDGALVQGALDRALANLESDVTTATVWNQAYEELRPGVDLEWADEEIGSYYGNNRGHDRTVVIDGAGTAFYAWTGGARVAPGALAAFQRDAAPLIARVRSLESSRRPPSRQIGAADPVLAETASGVLQSRGRYYLVAVSTVAPETPEAARRVGPGVVVVSAQRLDRQFLDGLRDLKLAEPSIEPAGAGRGGVALVDADGRVTGRVTWAAAQPGMQVLKAAAPNILIGFLILMLIAVGLTGRVRRIAWRLDLHEVELDRVMGDLVSARNKAEEANLAKSQFLANISHEIRTPLNGVLGMAQVLARGAASADQRAKLEIIRASGETLLAVLDDLLDLAKIESGRFELELHEFDLIAALDAATQPFVELAAQKDVDLNLVVADGAAGIWRGDSVRLRQVVANLVSNAVKFTSAGAIEVSVANEAGRLEIAVADSGVGIDNDRLAVVFEKFTQADNTMTRKYGGTGLGLAICKELVELMGGVITAQSEAGVGSTFRVVLPLERIGDATPLEEAVVDEIELPSLCVLAVDDNATNQILIKALLEPFGVEVRLAGDGHAALDAFASRRWDLILMDVQMPGMNGVEATRAIREIEASEGRTPTPILALSANVMRHQIDEYIAAGMDGFVAKPIALPALIGAINAALAQGEATGPGRSEGGVEAAA